MGKRARAAAVALLASISVFAGTAPALAEPSPTPIPSPAPTGAPSRTDVEEARRAVDDAAGRVRAIEARLAGARVELEAREDAAAAAAEGYNAARALEARRVAAAAAARRAAASARVEAGRAQRAVETMATQVYMQGGSLAGLELLLSGTTGDLARRVADLEAAMGFRAATLSGARAAATRATDAHRAAAQAQAQQQSAAAAAARALEDARAQVEAAAAAAATVERERTSLLTELAGLRRTSVDVERRREEALAAAAQRAREEAVRRAMARTVVRADGQAPTRPLPAPDTKAATAAIAFATAQLGDPYVWAAAGPDSWDCSGLTMAAWRAGGRSLPHYSGWQYGLTARVPIKDLKPGDLVFFGDSVESIRHVGLYVGDGTMIEAPRTGLSVRYSSIYRSSLLPYGGRV